MTSHALYSWPHSHYIWQCIHRICVITTTLLMISDQQFVWHHPLFMYDIWCTIHIVTSTLYTLTPLWSSHYIHCSEYTTQTIYDIKHMTTQTLYLPSHPLYLTLHPVYLCHQTQCMSSTTHTLCDITHTLFRTSHSVCMTSHEVFMKSHTYMHDITKSIFMTSYPL